MAAKVFERLYARIGTVHPQNEVTVRIRSLGERKKTWKLILFSILPPAYRYHEKTYVEETMLSHSIRGREAVSLADCLVTVLSGTAWITGTRDSRDLILGAGRRIKLHGRDWVMQGLPAGSELRYRTWPLRPSARPARAEEMRRTALPCSLPTEAFDHGLQLLPKIDRLQDTEIQAPFSEELRDDGEVTRTVS